jgi:hypothetical protein
MSVEGDICLIAGSCGMLTLLPAARFITFWIKGSISLVTFVAQLFNLS